MKTDGCFPGEAAEKRRVFSLEQGMHLAVSSPNLADSPAQLSSDTGKFKGR